MLSTQFIFIFSIIPFILSMPISDDALKTLKDLLKIMDQKITDAIRWRQTYCCENPEFDEELENIQQKVQNLLKIVKNSRVNVSQNEIKELFEAVESFLDKNIGKMEEQLKSLEAYSPKWRFDEALKEEIKSLRKCTVKVEQNAEFGIHPYLDQNRVESIRSKLIRLCILQTMAIPQKQNAYCEFFSQFFEIYNNKKQAMDKKLHGLKEPLEIEAITSVVNMIVVYICVVWFHSFETALVVSGTIVLTPMEYKRKMVEKMQEFRIRKVEQQLAELEAKKDRILQNYEEQS